MKRMRVGTKLLLLALLPVCCVVALVVISAASDYRSARRLSHYRAEARLSFAVAQTADELANEREAVVLVRLEPTRSTSAQLATAERATTQAFAQARARAAGVAAPVDVAGGLDAARRSRQALVLQLDAGSLGSAQIIAGYSVIAQNLLDLTAALDAGAPSPDSSRAAAAYGSILEAIESASHERVFTARLLGPKGSRPQPTESPWATLEAAELSTFRQNAGGPLAADLEAVLFTPAGVWVQRVRDELAANPAAAIRGISLPEWLSFSNARITALQGVAAGAERSLDGVVSNELDSAHANVVRDLALSLAFLAVVTALALALRRSITGPLREVSGAARGLAGGHMEAKVNYASQDEIGDVAAAFRDVHATADRLVEEIRAENHAVRENRLDHRADASGLGGVWSQLVGGMNETMASFVELQERREYAERETARIFEMSLDMLCVIGFDGYFKRINPAFERTLGYTREALMARPGFDFAHPDDLARSSEIFSALRNGDQVEQFENRNICADGSVRWLEWSARAVPEEELIYAVARDVTESRRAAEEQAALRRVATLVARGAHPGVIFSTVAQEVAKVLPGIDTTAVGRYTPDESLEFVGGWSSFGEADWVGKTVGIGGRNVVTAVFQTGQPARVDHIQDDATDATAVARASGARSSAGAPINVEGKLWGLVIVASIHEDTLPVDIEYELAGFTELLATAIANADAQAELTASRARIVASADEARRRIVRDLHDAAQQRLVHTIVTLKLARRAHEAGDAPAVGELVKEALDHAEHANTEFHELVYGILPGVLTRAGLAASVAELARRLRIPIRVNVTGERFAADIEATAYFVIAEALTNVTKHASAKIAEVSAEVENRTLKLEIHDDGIGGARADGRGLRGLADRVVALGGQLRVASPDGGGTSVTATLPLPD